LLASHFDVYTTLWYYYIVVFIESAAFSRRLRALAGSEERLEQRQHVHLLLVLDKDERADLSNEERTIIRGMVTELKKVGGTK
jgi:hypothetical protein